jgi:ribose 5-phosphate isomerase B
MNIAIGSDHRALELKKGILDFLTKSGYPIYDFGSYNADPIDYPDIAAAVAKSVAVGKYTYGILICGTGIGMCIAANKIDGIRAAQCRDLRDAQRARSHNNANILCLGSETTELSMAEAVIKTFLSTEFEGGRHLTRIEKIKQLEKH